MREAAMKITIVLDTNGTIKSVQFDASPPIETPMQNIIQQPRDCGAITEIADINFFGYSDKDNKGVTALCKHAIHAVNCNLYCKSTGADGGEDQDEDITVITDEHGDIKCVFFGDSECTNPWNIGDQP